MNVLLKCKAIFTLISFLLLACIPIHSQAGQQGQTTDNSAGLVAYYPFDGHANDVSGNNNHAVVHGALLTTNRFGGANCAYAFDGINDYILVLQNTVIPYGNQARTATMWIYTTPDSWANHTHGVFSYGTAQIRQSFGIDMNPYPNIQFYTWGDDLEVTTNLPEQGWIHLAFTYDGEYTIKGYVNGILMDSRILEEPLNTKAGIILIGHNGRISNAYFIGKIDDVRLYNRELSQQEIESLVHPSGLWINESSPNGTLSGSVNHVDVTFNRPIQAITFTNDDITLQGPGGSISIGNIVFIGTSTGKETYRVNFPLQAADGIYILSIGPNITSIEGELMDQDLDGIIGEFTEDIYKSVFIINNSPPPVVHYGNIYEDEIWGPGMHKVIGSILVKDGVTLTIDAGAIIKFTESTGIKVNGTLEANGTIGNPIIFTSIKDDTCGGDTNGDGIATEPAPGDWNGIYMESCYGCALRDAIGKFDYVRVRYGGGGNLMANIRYRYHGYYNSSSGYFNNSISEYGYRYGLYIHEAAKIEIDNSKFTDNYWAGIFSHSSPLSVNSCFFAKNGSEGLASFQSSLTVTNSIFESHSYNGLRAIGVKLEMTNNTFNNNAQSGVFLHSPSEIISYAGNSGIGNGINGARIGGIISTNQTWPSGIETFPLVVEGILEVKDGVTLTIEEGVIIKFTENAKLSVHGTLDANGTQENPIVFTSLKDDTYGGDTNGDENSTEPAPGDWYGIDMESCFGCAHRDAIGEFDYVRVRYGGSNKGYFAGNIKYHYHNCYNSSSGHFKNSISEFSARNGIVFYEAVDCKINNSILANNALAGIYIINNCESNTIINSTIANNLYGICSNSSPTIVTNSIVWGNTNYQIYGNHTVSYSVIQGGYEGEGNIDADPLFIDPANGDFHLQAGSPCINTGTNQAPFLSTHDFDGDPRILHGIVDMGMDEQHNSSQFLHILKTTPIGVVNEADHIEVVFSAPIDLSTFTEDDITLQGPTNNITITEINFVGSDGSREVYQIDFSSLTTDGDYNLSIGPNVLDTDGKFMDQDYDAVPGEFIDDIFHSTFGLDTVGPRVIKHNPDGDIAGTMASVDVWLSETIRNDSVLKNSIVITGPNGNINPSSIMDIGKNIYRINFPAQNTPGQYHIVLAANIIDLAGNSLDQDQDKIPGEEEDVYDASFNLADVDLALSNVTVNAAELWAGDPVQVSWQGANTTGVTLLGDWTDAVYFSIDDQWDIDDKLLATVPHTGGLDQNETYSTSLEVIIPGAFPGNYYLLVRSDIYNQEKESGNEGNNVIATVPLLLNIHPLDSDGTAVTGTFSNIDRVNYYAIDVSAGEYLQITLDDLNDWGVNEVYVGFENVPTRSEYDYKHKMNLTADQVVEVPMTQEGTYYVMVYGNSVPDETGSFTLTANLLDFQIFDIYPNIGGNTGNVTIKINPTHIPSDPEASLISPSGYRVKASQIKADPSGVLYATFPLTGADVGEYDLELIGTQNKFIENSEGEIEFDETIMNTLLIDAIEIVPGQEKNIEIKLLVPSAVRLGSYFNVILEYYNPGNIDKESPIIVLTWDDELKVSKQGGGGLIGRSTRIIGLSNTAFPTILPPGQKEKIVLRASSEIAKTINFSAYVIKESANEPDFVGYIAGMGADPTTEPWSQVIQDLKNNFGSTWDEYYQNLRNAAESMATDRQRFIMVDEILTCAIAEILDEETIQDEKIEIGEVKVTPANGVKLPTHTSIDGEDVCPIEPVLAEAALYEIALRLSMPHMPGSELPNPYYAIEASIHLNHFLNGSKETIYYGPADELVQVFKKATDVSRSFKDVHNETLEKSMNTIFKKLDELPQGQYIEKIENFKISNVSPPDFHKYNSFANISWSEPNSFNMGLAFGGMRSPYFIQAKDISIKWEQKGEDRIATFTGNIIYAFEDKYDFKKGGHLLTRLGYCVQQTGYGGIFDIKVVIEESFYGMYSDKLIEFGDCDGKGCEKREVRVVFSFDPNEKTGLAGQGTDKYIGYGDTLIPYTIRFENKKEATAPAVLVTITDFLDTDLDLSTFELIEIGFADQIINAPSGLQNYETNLDLTIENEFVSQPTPIRANIKASLDPDTRELKLAITGLDPETGWLPEDIMLGILYPNNDTHRGEGYLSYIIKPKANLPEGTEITNQASIVFDWNEPIITNETLNTIGEPLSIFLVEPNGIDDTADKSFDITWTDHDPVDQANIALYYDTDNTGQSGTLIVDNIPVSDESDKYTWNTADIPEGNYYIYAIIDDGVNPTITSYGSGPVTIEHPNTPPTIAILEPDGFNDAADQSYTITWTDEDIEDNAAISLYYDTDNQGMDGVVIANNISEDDETDSYIWDTLNIPAGNYYIYAIIDDGTNESVIDYSDGPITIYHLVPPINFTAKDTPLDNGGSIDLNWQLAPNDADILGYKIFRSKIPGAYDYTSPLTILNKGISAYSDNTAIDNQTYYYVIRSFNQLAESMNSSEVSAVAKDNLPPAVPMGLIAAPGLDRVSLTWEANTDTDLAGYHIYRRDINSSEFTRIGTVTTNSYIDANLNNWDTFYYAITAFDEVPNESDFSQQAKAVSPQGQTDDIAEAIYNLHDNAFKNNAVQRKRTFQNKLLEVKALINNGEFKEAINKLQKDILQKTDGCYGGNPKNDWIIDCNSQGGIYTAIINLVALLKTLL